MQTLVVKSSLPFPMLEMQNLAAVPRLFTRKNNVGTCFLQLWEKQAFCALIIDNG